MHLIYQGTVNGWLQESSNRLIYYLFLILFGKVKIKIGNHKTRQETYLKEKSNVFNIKYNIC